MSLFEEYFKVEIKCVHLSLDWIKVWASIQSKIGNKRIVLSWNNLFSGSILIGYNFRYMNITDENKFIIF